MRQTIVFLILSTTCTTIFANATKCENIFHNVKITLQVPFNAGGSFDLMARAFAEPFKEITGAKILIQNNPSLAGLSSLNSVIKSKPKEINLGFFAARNLIELSNNNRIKWQESITPLATYLSEDTVWLTRKNKPADLINIQEIVIAGSKNDELEAKAIAKLLGKSYRLISGYSGSAEYANAVMRGEVDFFGPARMTADRLIKTGDYSPALLISNKPDAYYFNTPHLGNIKKNVTKQYFSDTKLINITNQIVAISRSDRMIISSKNLPNKTLDCLDKSIQKTIRSESFTNKAIKLKFNINLESPKEAAIRLLQIDNALKTVHDFTND